MLRKVSSWASSKSSLALASFCGFGAALADALKLALVRRLIDRSGAEQIEELVLVGGVSEATIMRGFVSAAETAIDVVIADELTRILNESLVPRSKTRDSGRDVNLQLPRTNVLFELFVVREIAPRPILHPEDDIALLACLVERATEQRPCIQVLPGRVRYRWR